MENDRKQEILASIWPVHSRAVGSDVVEYLVREERLPEQVSRSGSPMTLEQSAAILLQGLQALHLILPMVKTLVEKGDSEQEVERVVKSMRADPRFEEFSPPVRRKIEKIVEEALATEKV